MLNGGAGDSSKGRYGFTHQNISNMGIHLVAKYIYLKFTMFSDLRNHSGHVVFFSDINDNL